MTPFFSIVLPVYNAEKYLLPCLRSIMNQSYSDFEVIIVDDGSTDSSGHICDDETISDKRFSVIHQENAGARSARYTGIRIARGKYIICMDSDDLIDRYLLSELYEVGLMYDPDVIAYDYQEIDEEGKKGRICENSINEGLYNEADLEIIKKQLIYDVNEKSHNIGAIAFSTWSKAIKKDVIEEFSYLSPKGIKNGEDLVVTIPAICNSQSVYILHRVGYYYRLLSDSMVHSFRYNELDRIVKVISHVRHYSVGVPDNNIYGYAYCMVLGQTVLASKELNSYKSFKIFVNNISEDLWDCVYKFKHKKLNWYSKIRLWALKHSVFLYWFMCRFL